MGLCIGIEMSSRGEMAEGRRLEIERSKVDMNLEFIRMILLSVKRRRRSMWKPPDSLNQYIIKAEF